MTSKNHQVTSSRPSEWVSFVARLEIMLSICGIVGPSLVLANGNGIKDAGDINHGNRRKYMMIGILAFSVLNLAFGISLLAGKGPGGRVVLLKLVICMLISILWDPITGLA